MHSLPLTTVKQCIIGMYNNILGLLLFSISARDEEKNIIIFHSVYLFMQRFTHALMNPYVEAALR